MGGPLFSKCQNNELWVMLLEKVQFLLKNSIFKKKTQIKKKTKILTFFFTKINSKGLREAPRQLLSLKRRLFQ